MLQDLEFEIEQKFQNGKHDCGHTCLDMLGYAGHEMFPVEEPLIPKQLMTVPGVEEKTLFQEELVYYKELAYYTLPHMWGIFAAEEVYPDNPLIVHYRPHWVIRHKDKIYCPVAGTMNYQEYMDTYFYFGFINHEFFVPVNRSLS